jgi:hypothetical protein
MNTLKSLSLVWREIADGFKTDPKSIATFERRVNGAGLPFLTIELPSLGKDLDRALDCGYFQITGRFKTRRDSNLPVFLYEHFVKVFYEDGWIRENPTGIKELRQLTLMFYKFSVPFTPSQELEATKKFIATDALVKTSAWHWTLPIVRKYFESLFPDNPMDIRPHHASGQTSDRTSNSEKRSKRVFIPSLHHYYSFSYMFNSENHYHLWREHSSLDVHEPKSRLAFVPKDSRGPRSICMEHHLKMFFQKGLQAKLYEYTETYSPAKGFINFTDQTVNRMLAQKASLDCSLATIDLKDASDLVSWPLIQSLTRDLPEWAAALEATRSSVVETSLGDIPLNKFAPMGSALCFPIEAFVFWSICRTITDKVWVYGDDLIVPQQYVGAVMDRLEQYGLMVNRDKSLYKGYFRESCGGEYYRGSDISIVRLKSLGTINYVAFCNNFAEAYNSQVADKMISHFEHCSGQIIARAPISERTARRGLVYYTDHTACTDVFFRRRWNKDLQRYEIKVPTVVDRAQVDGNLRDEDRLFDWFTQKCVDTSPAESAFHRSVNEPTGTLMGYNRLASLFETRSQNSLWSRNTKNKFRWVPQWNSPTRSV